MIKRMIKYDEAQRGMMNPCLMHYDVMRQDGAYCMVRNTAKYEMDEAR